MIVLNAIKKFITTTLVNIETKQIDEILYFHANQTATALGYPNVSSMLSIFSDEQQRKFPLLIDSKDRLARFITEDGLYQAYINIKSIK